MGNSPGQQSLVSYPFLFFLLSNYVAINEKNLTEEIKNKSSEKLSDLLDPTQLLVRAWGAERSFSTSFLLSIGSL